MLVRSQSTKTHQPYFSLDPAKTDLSLLTISEQPNRKFQLPQISSPSSPSDRRESVASNRSSKRTKVYDFVMGLVSARSSSSSILESAPFGEVDMIMELPESYVNSDLELLETGRFSDFAINCQHRTWRCHSLIVCSRSEWFDQALHGKLKDKERMIVLPDSDADDIDSLLRFIYSGDFSITKWAKANNVYTAACEAFYIAEKFSVELLKRPALKQIAIQTKHRAPGDAWEKKFIDAVRMEYHGGNLPQRPIRQLLMLEAVRSRGRYRANWKGIFSDEGLEKENVPRFRDMVKKLEKALVENEGDEQAVARMLRNKYNFVSGEASREAWLRDFTPQGRVI